jgi:hypothetical protein
MSHSKPKLITDQCDQRQHHIDDFAYNTLCTDPEIKGVFILTVDSHGTARAVNQLRLGDAPTWRPILLALVQQFCSQVAQQTNQRKSS